MRGWWAVWLSVLTAVGCHGLSRAPAHPLEATVPPQPNRDLPLTEPTMPVLDGRGLPRLPPRTVTDPEGSAFRRVCESDCLILATGNVSMANLLDQENRVPAHSGDCETPKTELRKTLRYYTALELKNRAAAEALERFFQLTELETRTDFLRKSFPIIDDLTKKARSAKMADVRYPLDAADLDRQRSHLESQLEQAELGSRLLNLDLKRRLGLPYLPAEERLWPVGDFAVDPTPLDPETAVNAAMSDRPELRGLRVFHKGLTVETLPDARDILRAASPLLGLGSSDSDPRLPWLLECLLQHRSRSDQSKHAELEVRKKQLQDLIADRERAIADETRAAVFTVNSQRFRAALARDRVLGWEQKLAEAEDKRKAGQPGAEFQVPQIQLELLKARSELASEIMAWHQARIKVKAAEGWLVWEAESKGKER